MDVISMLNSAAAAARMGRTADSVDLTPTPSVISNAAAASMGVATPPSEKTSSRSNSESRTPNRSRTPWDAGGYSLPLTLDTKLIRTQLTAKPVLYGESPTTEHHHLEPSSPNSPRHKFSDSRSSLGSCYTTASSNNSGSHSRISSLSTVSEFQPMSNLITEFSSLEAKISDENDRNSSSNSNNTAIHDETNSRDMMGRDMNDDSMVDPCLQPLSPFTLNNGAAMEQQPSSTTHSSESESRSHRAQSPSDAILFTSATGNGRGQLPDHMRRVGDTLTYGYQPGHKRSASAPDFPAVRTRYQPSAGFAAPIVEPPTYASPPLFYNQSFSMSDQDSRRVSSQSEDDAYGEDTTSSATHSEQTAQASSVGVSTATQPATQPWEETGVEAVDEERDAEDAGAASDYDEESTPRCLFGVRPCDTGSQLRKAVSHIFGRNKLCTRQIPDNAWVHYCRKHYQRSRYRAGPDYSRTQIGLVIRQINKIRNWSDYNLSHNRSSGVVTSWRLQLRKREEKRRESKQQMSQAGKKRRRGLEGDGYDDDEDDDDGQSTSRNSDFATQQGQAPPQWLIEKLGDGYTTDEVLGIARRLKDELEAGTTRLIPDIEILPNITSDRAEEPKPRTKPQRRAPPQPSRVPPSRSRLPPYGYGHRSTLSESSRGASHLDHLQDVVGMSHWDNPNKRQRGTEYGQTRSPWGQQTASLPFRPSNDPNGYSQGLTGTDYSYGMSMQRSSPGFPSQTGMSSTSWNSSSRLPTSQYGSGTINSAYPPLGTSSSGTAQTQNSAMSYVSGSGYGSSYQTTQQPYFNTNPYGTSSVQQTSTQSRGGLYGDAWGGYGQNGSDSFQQQSRMNGQSTVRTHQRHVSAPWPQSNMMTASAYQFTSPSATGVPHFGSAGTPLDPAMGHQRRSSMPHNQMATDPALHPRSMTNSSTPMTPGQTHMRTGDQDNSGMAQQSFDPSRPPSSNGRYDFGTTRH